jgi:hypothetical protein
MDLNISGMINFRTWHVFGKFQETILITVGCRAFLNFENLKNFVNFDWLQEILVDFAEKHRGSYLHRVDYHHTLRWFFSSTSRQLFNNRNSTIQPDGVSTVHI